MSSNNPTLAARFFFRNCAVSIYVGGELKISSELTPEPDDIIFDRNFIPLNESSFFGTNSDFAKFLYYASSTRSSLQLKCQAIGYILCNKLQKNNSTRFRSFLCVNEREGSACNGKTLFCEAIAQYCRTVRLNGGRVLKDWFAFSEVSERTQLVCVNDLMSHYDLCGLYDKCVSDWIINRKCQSPLLIEHAKSPHIIATTNLPTSKIRMNPSFRRRFTVLYFSDFFGLENRVDAHLGRKMFSDWNRKQWNVFDNLMLYCITEYLKSC